jgi:aldose 1-epimerase
MKFIGLVLMLLLAAPAIPASAQKSSWGTTGDGVPLEVYTLQSDSLTVRITNFGAHILSIEAPDRNGEKADVVLGFKDWAGYDAAKSTYIGAVVGRYGNRIAKGTFRLQGKTFHVPLNNGVNALHGGTVGYDQKVWTAKALQNGVELTLVSPDGDMGFPGELRAHVRYTLSGNTLRIEYTATTDKPTVVNLTNHSYFNLAGESSGSVLDQVLTLNSLRYTPVDDSLIPTGELATVSGTPFDFTHPTPIGARIHSQNQQLSIAGGYDHNFVVAGGGMRMAAQVLDPKSGRMLTVRTTEPGVQFYSGNFLDGTSKGVGGKLYARNAGFCLETQHYPDSPNRPSFPSTELLPGHPLHSVTTFTFEVHK